MFSTTSEPFFQLQCFFSTVIHCEVSKISVRSYHLPASSFCSNITSSEKLCLPFNYLERLGNLLNNTQVNSWDWLNPGLWFLKQRFKAQATWISRCTNSQNCISSPEGSLHFKLLNWQSTRLRLLQISTSKPKSIIFLTILCCLLSLNKSSSIYQATNLSTIFDSLSLSPIPSSLITYSIF